MTPQVQELPLSAILLLTRVSVFRRGGSPPERQGLLANSGVAGEWRPCTICLFSILASFIYPADKHIDQKTYWYIYFLKIIIE